MDCAVHYAEFEESMKVILVYFVLTSHCGPKSKQTTNGIVNIQCQGKVEVPEIFDSPHCKHETELRTCTGSHIKRYKSNCTHLGKEFLPNLKTNLEVISNRRYRIQLSNQPRLKKCRTQDLANHERLRKGRYLLRI